MCLAFPLRNIELLVCSRSSPQAAKQDAEAAMYQATPLKQLRFKALLSEMHMADQLVENHSTTAQAFLDKKKGD